MTERTPGLASLSPPDRQTLTFGPLWMFSMIAGSDGSIDEREVEELANVVERARPEGGPLFEAILSELTEGGSRLLAAYAADERDPDEGLRRVAAILDLHWAPEVGDGVKAGLHSVGRAVAAASGGILGLGDPTSATESVALTKAARCLGLKGDPDPPLGAAAWPPFAP